MSGHIGHWGEELERAAPEAVTVAGVSLRRGSRVRLHPRAGGDVFDLALAGRSAMVDAIEQDLEDNVVVAVTVDDDPGRDLGALRQPGHRFFFAPSELEPLASSVLIAGIGNVFLGDDGFGVALASRLAQRDLPAGVEVVDYGIRGMDLAYALGDGWDAVVLLDATPRGAAPGTLYVIEPEVPAGAGVLDAHGMDPVKVLGLARVLGGLPPRTLVVGCEPQTVMAGDEEDVVAELSPPVAAALAEAERLVLSVLDDLTDTTTREGDSP